MKPWSLQAVQAILFSVRYNQCFTGFT